MPTELSLIERMAFALNLGPPPVLDYIGALGLRSVSIAERLGLLALFQGGPLSAREAAAALGARERGVAALLRALEAVGYVRARGGRYQLTTMAATWMPRFREGMRFFDWMAFAGWEDVEEAIRGGSNRPVKVKPPWEDGDGATSLGGMLSNARVAADEVARRVKIGRSGQRLLDVAGGHGLYSARFCARHPQLRATLIDREPALEQARSVLRGEGGAERVELKAADIWSEPLGSGYDLALLFNVLNAYPPDRNVDLLAKIAGAVAPGGALVILDQMRRPALRGTARAIVELTNLRLFDPDRSDTYALQDLLGWLEAARWSKVQVGSLRAVPWLSFVVARRPGASAPVRRDHA